VFRRRLRLSAAAGAGLLIAATAATLGTPPTVAAPVDDPVVQVTIDSFGPVAPKPGDDVLIKGTVRNTSTETLEAPQALACIDRTHRLTTAAEIAAVPAEQDVAMDDRNSCSRMTTPDTGVFQQYDAPLAPNASMQFSLKVPWNEWRISKQTGVYVVGVVVRGTPQGQERLTVGRARTLMPVIGEQPLTRTVNTALIIPLQHRPTQLGGKRFTNESLAESMAPNGRLGRLLALGNGRKVTWLVDPATLDEARSIVKDGYDVGEGGKPTPGAGRAVVEAWLKAFDASRARGNQVVLLPYGDPDIAGLLDAGDPLKELVYDARKTTERFSLPPGFTNGLWLEGGAAASRYLAAASQGFPGASNDDLNLVGSGSWPAVERAGLTATSPVYDIRTPEGPRDTVRTVVADSALTAGGPDPDTGENPIQVRQRFAAETALIAAGGKGSASVVAVPPRGWDSTGRATAALAGDLALPWINATSVGQVVAGTPRPPVIKAPAAPRSNAIMSADQLDGVKQLDQATTTFKDLLTNPAEDLPEAMPQALLRSASISWRGFPDEAKRFAAVELGSVNLQLSKVHLVNNAVNGEHREIKVNLAGSKGTFPLTITNDTDWSVRVGIVVSPTNRTDLRIEPQQTRILAPKQKFTPRINASAEQNGLIRASAQVITASGRPVGKSQELLIQASQYGSVGWILVGAACALLFGTSFVRIYRRIRTERRHPSPAPSSEAAVDEQAAPDALHPEPLDPPSTDAPAGGSLKEGVGSKDG
jgi:hypothetical protein